MLEKCSKRRVVLFTAIVAIFVLGAPAMASALSWGPLNTTHDLDSSNTIFLSHDVGTTTWLCTETQMHVHVRTAAVITVTNFTFPKDCHGVGLQVNCTVTMKATQLPWTMTAPAANNVQIHGMNFVATFENSDGLTCPINGTSRLITGTPTGGVWDAASHHIRWSNAPGLISHPGGVGVTFNGTYRDTAQTLTLS